jgi:TPP-dependent pyruvate/acetoin dehydrogenase alpha subunit
VLLEALTYRWHGHYEGDRQDYKPEEEVQAWMARDPLIVARTRIEKQRLATPEELDTIVAENEARIDRAEAFARSSPFPTLDEIYTDVYGD